MKLLLLNVCVICCLIPSTAFADSWSESQQAVFKADRVHVEYRSGSTRVVVDHIRSQGQRVITYINGKRYRTGYVFWTTDMEGAPEKVYASWSLLHQFESCSRFSTFGNWWDPRSAPYTLLMTGTEQLMQQPPAIKQASARQRGTRTYLTLKRRIGNAQGRAALTLHRFSARPLVARVSSKSQGTTRRAVTRFSYNVPGAIQAPKNKC